MKYYLTLTFMIALQINVLAQEAIQKLPPHKTERIRKIDVRHMTFDLRFDWDKKQASGTVVIDFLPLASLDKITLDAGMLTINSVTCGTKTLPFRYDGGDADDGLEITLDRHYQPKEPISLTIAYHTNYVNQTDPNSMGGSFGKGLRFIAPTAANPIKRQQVWSIGEAEINRYWFPCYDAPNDHRTTDFFATVSQNLTVIANGKLTGIKNNADNTHTFHYKTDTAYPNFLTSFAIGEYLDIPQQSGKTTLHTFAYPDEKTAAEATIERLPDMLRYFEKITGCPFPYASYSQVMVQEYPFPGLTGSPGMSTISDNMIDDFKTHADYLYLWDGVEADALASQWFGNYITAKGWSDTWLSKSFARYLDGLYTDYKNGHDEYLLWYHPYDTFLTFGDWNSGNRHPIVTQNFENTENFVGDNYARYRGSLVLRMLQNELGDAVWFKTIRHYVKTNAGKAVTTADFQKAVETVSGRKMDWFFEQWVYQIGHPVFEVAKTYHADKKELTLHLKQIQKTDPNSPYPQTQFFAGKIAIEIDSEVHTLQLEAKADTTFTFTLAQAPKLVNVDFENNWIREIKMEKTVEEWLYQLENSRDVLARNAAISPLAVAYKTATSDDREKIKNSFRKVIQSSCYWRLKTTALSGLLTVSKTDTEIPEFDASTTEMLLQLVEKGEPWVRVAAVTQLGLTNDPKFSEVYARALHDSSERVVAAAAIALGKTKSPLAYDILSKLKDKPSWKNQSLMSALNGLKELGDPRGAQMALDALADNLSPRWFLANGWDYPLVAAQALHALGKTEQAYPILLERFKKAMAIHDVDAIFSTTLLIATIADARSQEVFELLKEKFKDDANAMVAVNQYEEQFKRSLR